MNKTILLTGGGTAGHVTPNIALIPALQKKGWIVHYMGTPDGIEKKLIEQYNQQVKKHQNKITYHGVASGKLRRYFDVKNFTDPLKVMKGMGQAAAAIRKIKPNVIFSKGGFVTVPVILGGWLNRIPIVIHESDMTPGLANRISIRFANKICTTFPETLHHLPKNKGIHTGTPIRQEIFLGNKEKGRERCHFTTEKPVIMMMGGSLGSVKINTCLREALPKLLETFQVVHLCGKGNLDSGLKHQTGYMQFEYLNEELPHIFALADVVLSRAGANSISEILALHKPNILIPLSARASRGDQILNAKSFQEQGYSCVLEEEKMTQDTLYQAIHQVYQLRFRYKKAMEQSKAGNGIQAVLQVLEGMN